MDCQRWRERRDSYRPAGEPIDPRGYEVGPVGHAEARSFVEAHHYSASYPAARRRHGLYRGGELVGVAVYSMPMRGCVLTSVFPGDPRESVELGRFVLLDEVPANGESWMLARSLDLLRREGLRGVVSFSDPLPRQDASGRLVMPGHVGTIYQASNAAYLGRSRGEWLWLLPDGTIYHRRALDKARSGDQGWRYAVEALVRHGAAAPACLARGAADPEELRPWAAAWLPVVARRVKHPGNHRYAFALAKADRRAFGTLPRVAYPKRGAA